MGDDKSLLDWMLDEHKDRPAPEKPVSAQERKITVALDKQRREEAEAAERRARNDAVMRAAEAAASRPVEMCGLRVGDRFEMKNCRPEVLGQYIVVRIDPGRDGDPSRRMEAKRADGRTGALRLEESKIRDAIHFGLLVPR